jgi:hypothetical protein
MMTRRNARSHDSDACENRCARAVFLLTCSRRVQIAWDAHEPSHAIRARCCQAPCAVRMHLAGSDATSGRDGDRRDATRKDGH